MDTKETAKLPKRIFDYPQLDPQKGMDYCGDAEDYLFALETFEASAPEKAGQIEESLTSEDWEALTTRIHSLKSTAGAIGATDLSERAKALELVARSGDLETVKRDTPDLLKEYRLLGQILGKVLEGSELSGKESTSDNAGPRILLAEDMEVNALILEQVLSARDYAVDIAANGEEAIALFEKSEPGTYAAILMDIRMPKMNGLEATAAIRAIKREDAKDIPIIALTADTFDEGIKKALEAGMNAYLTKPVEPDRLLSVLKEQIK